MGGGGIQDKFEKSCLWFVGGESFWIFHSRWVPYGSKSEKMH